MRGLYPEAIRVSNTPLAEESGHPQLTVDDLSLQSSCLCAGIRHWQQAASPSFISTSQLVEPFDILPSCKVCCGRLSVRTRYFFFSEPKENIHVPIRLASNTSTKKANNIFCIYKILGSDDSFFAGLKK